MPMAWMLVRILPERKQPADPSLPRYLDEAALETPSLAIANAARETLRMGDTVETMLRQVMTAIMTNDRKLAGEVSRMDNIVDRLTEAIKLYIAKLTRDSLDEGEGRRAMEIVSFAINLEHIGDIIDKNLCELAAQEDQATLPVLPGRRSRADGIPQAHLRELASRVRHVHDRRSGSCAQAAPREGRIAQGRA